MVSVYEVSPNKLILLVAKDIKKKVKAPEYTKYVKTGIHKERAPDQEDWFYIRMAAILRKFYTKRQLGVEILRGYFGGKQRRGVRRSHFKKASGKIIRDCVQALEKEGYLKKTEKGRKITPNGRKYLNLFAKQIASKK
jgi:small subunit ribosomal protein S19e